MLTAPIGGVAGEDAARLRARLLAAAQDAPDIDDPDIDDPDI